MTQDPIEASLEVCEPGVLEKLTRAEIDVQIATAKRYPRSMESFKKRAIDMACIDEETAASCIYCRPVGKKFVNGKEVVEYAEGLSVRTAEIVGASYGNLRVGAMLIEQTETYVKARGMAHDLESNFAATSEIVESTLKSDGKTPYTARMRVVIAKSALAKARRDVTFMVVPRALCKPVEKAARQVALGDAKSIAQRRSAVVAWIGKLGIDVARVWSALSIGGEGDLDQDKLVLLTGIKTALKDGDITVEEAFPVVASAPAGLKSAAKKAESAPEDDLPMAPKEAAPAPKPKATDGAAVDPLAALRDHMTLSTITEAELKAVLVPARYMNPGDEVPALSDNIIRDVLTNWNSVVGGVKANRSAAEKKAKAAKPAEEPAQGTLV